MNQDRNGEQAGYHRPVLADEVAELMAPVMPGVVVDATFGGGGHTRRLLDEFGDEVTVVAIDRDPEALANAAGLRATAVQGNFADMASLVAGVTSDPVSAVLFDFGVSSHQLDEAARGFSYHSEGPLDMRMGPDATVTAGTIVNLWPVADLARIIRVYGEEPMARRIATAIVAARPIESTTELSTVIAQAMPAARRRAGHPARRTFQAIRIAVNFELEALATGLDAGIELVRPGGRVIAISYHSLEDRIVKRKFAAMATGCTCPPGLPVCGCGNAAEARILTRKPIRPTPSEIEVNKRARSAVLRAMEKVAASTTRPLGKVRSDDRLRVLKGKRLRRPSIAPWMIMVIIAVVSFLGLGFARTSLDGSAFELAELTKSIDEQSAVNEQLRLEVARLENPARIAPLAAEMGLVIPATTNQLLVNLDVPSPVVAETDRDGANQ